MVYDITSPKSFESLATWKDDFLTKAGPRNPETFPFFLFGNKADRASTDRKIPTDVVEKWRANNNNLPYEETSALEGTNVEASFYRVARSLLKTALQQENPLL